MSDYKDVGHAGGITEGIPALVDCPPSSRAFANVTKWTAKQLSGNVMPYEPFSTIPGLSTRPHGSLLRYNCQLGTSHEFIEGHMGILGVLSFFVPFVGSILMLYAVLRVLVWRRSSYPRESPLTKGLLRPPGFSLRQHISDQLEDYMLSIVAVIGAPTIVYAIHISQSYIGGVPENVLRIAASTVIAVGTCSYFSWRLWQRFNDLTRLHIGLDGESFTGEELNQLMLKGCRVFHDIPFPYGNIDHVVVSVSGVHSINTKTWGKPKKGDDKAELTVDFKAREIRLPDRTIPISWFESQLETESRWLADFLTSAVGFPVSVEPMLALPGWYISREGSSTPCVFNPSNADKFFVRSKVVLTTQQIQQIAHQLEQLCRDRRPAGKSDMSWTAGRAS